MSAFATLTLGSLPEGRVLLGRIRAYAHEAVLPPLLLPVTHACFQTCSLTSCCCVAPAAAGVCGRHASAAAPASHVSAMLCRRRRCLWRAPASVLTKHSHLPLCLAVSAAQVSMAHRLDVNTLAVDPTNRFVVTGGTDGLVKVCAWTHTCACVSTCAWLGMFKCMHVCACLCAGWLDSASARAFTCAS